MSSLGFKFELNVRPRLYLYSECGVCGGMFGRGDVISAKFYGYDIENVCPCCKCQHGQMINGEPLLFDAGYMARAKAYLNRRPQTVEEFKRDGGVIKRYTVSGKEVR
jgi:hypothetical protein